MSFDEKIMLKCIDLAKKGKDYVFPNPMVGSIIVCENEIIGQGFHEKYGDNHAEFNAINSVIDKSKLKKSTIYVNLEPCSHYNNTPPCADLIIKNKIKNVVIGTQDPFHLVKGNGIERLKKYCNVLVGVCEKECKELNHRFFVRNIYKRPFIILKWAQSKDGFINGENYKKGIQKISGNKSHDLSHYWRSQEDAIMVGKNTLLYDNPLLTVRRVKGKNPKRIILNKNIDLPKRLNVFNNESENIILSDSKMRTKQIKNGEKIIFLDFQNVNFIKNMMKKLYENQIQSIIIEGGSTLINSFIKKEFWDEIRCFSSSDMFKKGVKAPDFSFSEINYKKIEKDKLFITKNLNII